LKRYQKTVWVVFVLVIVLSVLYYFLVPKNLVPGTGEKKTAEFVGSKSCTECHETEYNDWLKSDHYVSMDTASPSSVLANFDTTIERNGEVHRFYKKDDRYFVYTNGEDGSMQELEVKYTFGAWPLQNYLIPFDGGRMQTLVWTWDTIRKQWYHMADKVYPDEVVDHTNWLYWTNQGQNWNGMCADCHSTNLKKGFDPETKTYHTTWSEINVGCEACHGPASEHLKWADMPEAARPDDANYGLVVQTSHIDNKKYVDGCARCHARRSVFDDYDYTWHNLLDQMIPELPREPFYFADGQILEEDYVFGSFTQSKMYMNDVQCNNCHNVHSGKLIMDTDKLCLQCHRPDEYDTYTHHFHKKAGEAGGPVVSVFGDTYEVGEGAKCINCHMPGRYYMGIDFRRDHSFRIPRPDLSDKLGTPNACTTCHGDKTNQWAAARMKEWYGDISRQHYGSYLASACREANREEVISSCSYIINDKLFPPMTRAAAMAGLNDLYPQGATEIMEKKLHDPEALIQYIAVRNYPLRDSVDMQSLLEMLNNPVKAVRTEAAVRLSELPASEIPPEGQKAYKKALDEYEKSQLYSADFAASRHNLGNLYRNQGDTAKAIRQYEEAILIDNKFYPAKINLAMLYYQKGESVKAERLFKEILEEQPEQVYVNYSLGLLLAEMKQYDEALHYLKIAVDSMPANLRARYNLAQLQRFLGDDAAAETNLKILVNTNPDAPDYLMALIDFYLTKNEFLKARPYVITLAEKYPDDPQVKQLLDFVESKLP
jgi:predicted CXXCH cytochrome family protein